MICNLAVGGESEWVHGLSRIPSLPSRQEGWHCRRSGTRLCKPKHTRLFPCQRVQRMTSFHLVHYMKGTNAEAVVTHIERFENSVAAGACCDLHATPFKPVLVKIRFNETLATAECIGKSLDATLSDVIAAEEEALHA